MTKVSRFAPAIKSIRVRRRRPATWPAGRWVPTDPDIDTLASEPAPYTDEDLREVEYLFGQEPDGPENLDEWIDEAAPEPEVYHNLEQQSSFYEALGRLGQLCVSDID